jgi:hypothetical protein
MFSRGATLAIILGGLVSGAVLFSSAQTPNPREASAVTTSNPAIRSRTVQRQVDLGTAEGDKTVIQNGRMVRRIDRASSNAVLRPNEFIVARWAQENSEVAPMTSGASEAWSLGFGFIGVTPSGQEIRFRPVIESTGGLALSKNASGFQGRIYVGLRDSNNPSAAYPLPQPISLLVDGQADELVPRQLTIDHTNLPFAEVSIGAQDPPDAIAFSLIAAGTSERATVSLSVVRPRLELIPARTLIQGLGLETAMVSVRAVGLPSPEGRLVTVTSDFASVDPTNVRLDDQGVGTTTVRSVSFGTASIRAASPPLTPATTPIEFSWPVAFLVASVLGGVAGAALARFQRSGSRKKGFQVVLIRGVLTGLIVVALYAIGVNVLPVQPTATAGEVLAFALAAVGGFLGFKI